MVGVVRCRLQAWNLRRRTAAAASSDSRYWLSLDWYALGRLLAVSVGILVLSAADAFLTLTLLFANGASG